MKKLLVVALSLALVFVFSAYAFGDNTIKIGYNFSPQSTISGITSDVNSGFDVGYEYTVNNGQVGYGVGIAYQLERAFKNQDQAKFYNVPVYGVFTYDIAQSEQFKPYLTARLGYNLYFPNDFIKTAGNAGNGVYYAAGFGAKFSQFKAEVLYEVNSGTLNKVDITNFAYALKLGYSF